MCHPCIGVVVPARGVEGAAPYNRGIAVPHKSLPSPAGGRWRGAAVTDEGTIYITSSASLRSAASPQGEAKINMHCHSERRVESPRWLLLQGILRRYAPQDDTGRNMSLLL